HGDILFFFQAEDGIRDGHVTGVQTCALPILELRLRALLAPPGPRAISRQQQHHGAERCEGGGIVQELVDDTGLWRGGLLGGRLRSEERRVGKGWGGRGWAEQ